MESKIKTISEIEELAKELKNRGKTLITTNGSFDILHSAHVHLLEKAKAEGDYLIVLLNSDNSIRKNKGDKRPIVNENERAHMLSSLSCVDFIVVFDDDKPLDLLEKIKPNKHIKGGTFIEERLREEKDLLASWNGEHKTFPLEDGFSTTNIINKILESYE